MSKAVRQPPAVSEQKDFRALESFHQSIEAQLKMVGSTTVDLASLAAGATDTVTVTVQGARPNVGQTVQVGVSTTLNTGLLLWGIVTANDTVTVYRYNRTGSAIDSGSEVYSVRVMP
jgi:hypothetical protein